MDAEGDHQLEGQQEERSPALAPESGRLVVHSANVARVLENRNATVPSGDQGQVQRERRADTDAANQRRVRQDPANLGGPMFRTPYAVVPILFVCCSCATTRHRSDTPFVTAHTAVGNEYYRVDGKKHPSLALAVADSEEAVDAASSAVAWGWASFVTAAVGLATYGVGSGIEGSADGRYDQEAEDARRNGDLIQDVGFVVLLTAWGFYGRMQAAEADAINIFNQAKWDEIRRAERERARVPATN